MPSAIPTVVPSDYMIIPHYNFKDYKFKIGDRPLPLDHETVRNMADDIKKRGLLDHIIVTSTGSTDPFDYVLVDGHHRLEAIQIVWKEVPADERINYSLPVRVMHLSGTDGSVKETGAAANLYRNHLTRQERGTLATIIGEYQIARREAEAAELSTNGTKLDPKQTQPEGRPSSWFSEWHKAAKIPKMTAHREWDTFCASAKLTITPANATLEQQKQFIAWYGTKASRPRAVGTDPAAAAKEAQKALYSRRMTEITAKTGLSQQVINKHWKRHYPVDPVPSAASDEQWDAFDAALIASLPPKAVTKTKVEPEVVWKAAVTTFREAMVVAKAAGVNVGETLRDLLEDA